jgi:hypothetical protein
MISLYRKISICQYFSFAVRIQGGDESRRLLEKGAERGPAVLDTAPRYMVNLERKRLKKGRKIHPVNDEKRGELYGTNDP